MTWCDTSFVVSVYIRDANADRAAALMRQLQQSGPVSYTPLHRFETRNAIRLAVFRGQITPAQRQHAIEDINADIRDGALERTRLRWPAVFRQADALSATHTESLGNRSIDILHVAAALSLDAADFATFDTRQRALAAAAGLNVLG